MDFQFYFTIGAYEWRPQWLELEENDSILLPASSWAGKELKKYGKLRRGIPPVNRMPPTARKKAADGGGFPAAMLWGGKYPYSPEQYDEWLQGWLPDWAATLDFCCEDELTSGNHGIIRERQQKTTENAYLMYGNYQNRSYAWVPTVQGWNVSDYVHHAQEMKPLILEMQAFYKERDGQQSQFRVGIGTLCKRRSIRTIINIVMEVASILPEVECFHLWGLKTDLWEAPVAFPFRVSSDSASFNMAAYYGQLHPEWKQWVEEQRAAGNTEASNRMHRCRVMIPRTREKIARAMSRPKQQFLF